MNPQFVVALDERQFALYCRVTNTKHRRVYPPGLWMRGRRPEMDGPIYVLPDGFRNWYGPERMELLQRWRLYGGEVVYVAEDTLYSKSHPAQP